ncbi:MAG: hypothetical protein QXW82_04650 [Candidatus Bathyarchaeia archaeon]
MIRRPIWISAATASALVLLLVLTPVCQSNPIPVNYRVKMSEENITIHVYPPKALVEGIYTFEKMWGETINEVQMFYPLPSNAQNIKVTYVKDGEQEEINWKRSNLTYETAVGNYSVIEWTVNGSPSLAFPFRIFVKYDCEIPRQNEAYFMLYAMGSIKLTDQLNLPNLVYSKDCRVTIDTYFKGKPEVFDAYLVGVWEVEGVQVPDGKWSIQEGKMGVLRHESKWVKDRFVVSTELRLGLLTMRCDYALQFKEAESKFAWIEKMSTGKGAYKPGENVTIEVAVRRGNDMLAVVYEAEVRYRLFFGGEEAGFLGSSHVEIPSANGQAGAHFAFRLPDKMNFKGQAVVQAELWSWNSNLEDVKEVILEVMEDGSGEFPPAGQTTWISATAVIAAVTVIAALVAAIFIRKFRRG